MSNRPPYLYPLGSVNMHAPLELHNANMYGFFIRGDLGKLQNTVDSSLNTAAGTKRFQVLSPYVLTTFTKVGHANSSIPVDKNKGFIQELDIVTWVMVGDMQNGKVSHIYFYPAHIFVDNTMALVNGRELFGYPKYDCVYAMPELGQDPTAFSLSVQGFEPFSPDTQIALHPLLEVNASNKRPHRKLRTWLEFIVSLLEIFKSMPDALNLNLAGWEDVLSLLTNPRTDQIFLKQFPDSAGEKAVYQAVLAAPANVDTIHSIELLGYDYSATLHQVSSFPLADSLGFALGEQAAIAPFNLYFDFTVVPGQELVVASLPPEKIAILGGGVGSMTAAYFLTSQPDWQQNYDITVYQMGWRLGGKGASGRNANFGERIEEHGLHIWFGFYENAFEVIQGAYNELGRPPEAPLAAWTDAFKPQDFITLSENIDGDWKMWNLFFPTKPGTPGDGSERLSVWQCAQAVLAWIKQWLGEIKAVKQPPLSSGEHPDWLHSLAQHLEQDVENLALDAALTLDGLFGIFSSSETDYAKHPLFAAGFQKIKQWLEQHFATMLDGNDELRRLFICLDLGLVTLTGMLEDGVFKNGFDVINNLDFRAWLTKHGANQQYTVNSAPVRGFYDLVFAYENGDYSKPNIEAGTILRSMMLIGIAYKGSIMQKMQAGMGDTIFSPLYQVLKARGVKFKFFHKVEELIPDGEQIGQIRLTEQVAVSSGNDQYEPLRYVKGLACWGSAPNYDQLVPAQAALLQANNINLESNWSNWVQVYEAHYGQPLPTKVLQRSTDFDRVVFGISVGAFAQLCPQLVAQKPALQAMSQNVQSVATQAYQVWFNQPLGDLGWTYRPEGQETVLSGFTEPFDTWAAMDQLLVREAWQPGAQEPQNVSYFCSVLPVQDYPPPSDFAFPKTMLETVKNGAINQLETEISALLPNTGTPFDWNLLSDYSGASGSARFNAQFARANIDPSERYVVSFVNSTQYRLTAEQTGYKNLYFAGDWLKTGINAGCVEAAVMGGMQASRAISGFPKKIKGEDWSK